MRGLQAPHSRWRDVLVDSGTAKVEIADLGIM